MRLAWPGPAGGAIALPHAGLLAVIMGRVEREGEGKGYGGEEEEGREGRKRVGMDGNGREGAGGGVRVGEREGPSQW